MLVSTIMITIRDLPACDEQELEEIVQDMDREYRANVSPVYLITD